MALISCIQTKSILCLKSIHYFIPRNYNTNLPGFIEKTFRNQCYKLAPCTLFEREFLPCSVVSSRYMAGHSKWQNIKHVKAEKDRQKGLICNKYVRLIQYAVRESGPDPKTNNKLASLIEEAKKNNIAKDTLENAMKKGGSKMRFGTMEILAPGGCMLIVEYETTNESLARHEMKYICKKYNANILSGEGGRWRAVFEKKGIITVVKDLSGGALDEGKALDSAIEAGAEEVQMKENEEGKNFLEFVCSPGDINQVKKELEKLYEVEENYIAYIAINTIKLNDEDMNLVDGLLEEMGNVSDVVRIYENVQ